MTDVRSIREELGLTQGQLADQLGVSQPTISRLEAGGAVIDRRTALALDSLLTVHRREQTGDAANAAPQQGASSGNADEVSSCAGIAA